MVFTTLEFMIFMTAVFILYYAVPRNKQWCFLLLASYVFYAFASPLYLIFLFFTTAVTYLGSRVLDRNYINQDAYLKKEGKDLSKEGKKAYKTRMQRKQREIIVSVTVILLLMLGVFKYANFAYRNFSSLLGIFGVKTNDTALNIILPVGLSFYIFQSLGYCIDVYREMVAAEYNFFRYALYVSFFPQLLQGPIGDYRRLAPQLFREHEFSYTNAKYGLQRVAWGFFKKLVIANHISLIIDGVWSSCESYNGFLFWMFVLILYSFQLYADFSGYMDIAVGCAQMLGITLDENFKNPYLSKSIAEFWRKWHITLGAWFKNYVFYPILRTDWCNGIRKKYKKTHPYISKTVPDVIALLIVWTLIGLWHGADWSYVVYGLFHGSFIILSVILEPVYIKIDERFPGRKTSKIYSLFQIARTFIIVTFGYAIFRPADLSVTGGILHQMFSGTGFHDLLYLGGYNFKEFIEIFIGMSALLFVDVWHYNSDGQMLRDRISKMSSFGRWLVYITLLLLIIIIGAYGKSELNQFAYFRF